jgi:hypothetical protein
MIDMKDVFVTPDPLYGLDSLRKAAVAQVSQVISNFMAEF